MRVGGVIVIDNVLWHGKVADPMVNNYELKISPFKIKHVYTSFARIKTMYLYKEQVNDAKTVSIRNFNKSLMEDQRVSISMVSLILSFFLHLSMY